MPGFFFQMVILLFGKSAIRNIEKKIKCFGQIFKVINITVLAVFL